MNMNLITQDFWIRVQKLIKEKHLTQEALCNACNINLATYGGWNTRGVYPNARQVVDMAKCLGTTAEYLTTGQIDDIPADISKLIPDLKQFTEEERKPIIAMINGQIEYWKKILNK